MQTIELCEDVKIHIPERIQSFGYLFALEVSTGNIKIYSANAIDLFTFSHDLYDFPFHDLLVQSTLSWADILETFEKARQLNVRLPVEFSLRCQILKNEAQDDFHGIVYSSGSYIVVEMEPALAFKGKVASRQQTKMYSLATVPRFNDNSSLQDTATSIVDMVRRFTGYERVMIYRFAPDNSGLVIAESKIDEIDSFLGLHYPESDIPVQARELYKKNWLRMTANSEAPSVPLLPSTSDCQREPLDMTHSVVRSMAPSHLQYLKNLGICSSMSVSLYSQDRLWGLVICHHRSEYYLPQDMRLEVESLAHLFSWQLYAKEEQIRNEKRDKADRIITEMISQVTEEKSITTIFMENEEKILSLMKASGFMFSYGDLGVSLGRTLPANIIEDLMQLAALDKVTGVYSSSRLFDVIEDRFDHTLAGAMLIPLLKENNFYTIWFRDEKPFVRKWAGNPEEKNYFIEDKTKRLLPRKSFVVHNEWVYGECEAWTEEDERIAIQFNEVFLQHALRNQVFLKSNIELLTAQDKSRNEFLATLAHELRNPLAPISTAVDLIRNDEVGELRTETASIIERQLKQMVTLIDDLMDVSRITRGRIVLKLEEISLCALIEQALDSVRPNVKKRGLRLLYHPPQEDITIKVDVTRIVQVLSNLLTNAVKYSQPQGSIVVRTFQWQHSFVIEVEDDGIGISEQYLPKIFEMFSQADPFSTSGVGGLGIGLTLAKKLVELHGGKITASSEGVGMGSRFSFEIPQEPELGQFHSSFPKYQREEAAMGQRILVVDDNVDSARMLELLLKSKGHEVIKATSGTEGLAKFHEFKPDIALLDIGIPDMDGYEICRAIRASPYGKNVYVVAQTGWGQDEHLRRSREAGFDKHLVKPIMPATLWSLIDAQTHVQVHAH